MVLITGECDECFIVSVSASSDKNSGRTIERLACNSDMVNIKCVLFEVPFICPLNG